jgi:hypothetical protein
MSYARILKGNECHEPPGSSRGGQFCSSGTSATLPPDVVQTFFELGDSQRGKPEIAMTKAQFALGGGVLSVAIEHTGDLTHRMTDQLKYGSAGYGNVKSKVDKVLNLLRSGYGFRREYVENLEDNADFAKVPRGEYMGKAIAALDVYAREHSKLRVYNEAQWHAREAAIALGGRDFSKATMHLSALEKKLKTKEEWTAYATQFERASDGKLKEFRVD